MKCVNYNAKTMKRQKSTQGFKATTRVNNNYQLNMDRQGAVNNTLSHCE